MLGYERPAVSRESVVGHPLRGALRLLLLVAGYLGVMAWLTWPLAASAWSSMPATGPTSVFDMYYSAWILAWESHALATPGTAFADANIYHPASSAVFYGPAALGALPLFAPVFLATGNPAFAVNVTFLLGLALTGAGMHEIVRRWTGSDAAGVVAGVTVLANQWLIWGFVPTAPHWAALFCFPVIVYLAATRLESRHSVLLLAVAVLLQSLTDIVYVAPAVMAPLGVLAALRFLRSSTRGAAIRLFVAVALAGSALVPVLLRYFAVQADNPELALQTNWVVTADQRPSVLPDQLFEGFTPFLLTPVAIGVFAMGLLALALRRRAGRTPPIPGGWAHGVLWTLVGGCMAQNATVLIDGTPFTTPLGHLMELVPTLEAIRMPSRTGVAGLVGLGVLTGVAFGEVVALLRTRFRRPVIPRALASGFAAIVVVFLYQAYVDTYWNSTRAYGATPATPRRMPAAYSVSPAPTPVPASFLPLLRSAGTPLLELPLRGSPTDPTTHARAMYNSISHWRPLLNGYSSYWPEGFVQRMVLAKRLPDAKALERLVEQTGVALVWVHAESLPPVQRQAWLSLPAPTDSRVGLALVAREGLELLFEVRVPPRSSS